MISVVINKLPVLRFGNISGFPELFHFSSTRVGGCSTGNYSSLNLGFSSGDHPENVTANRLTLCTALEINSRRLVLPKQSHSATVKTITPDYFGLDKEDRKRFVHETDAFITNLKGVCIAVKTADCVPVLLFDSKQKVVAAVHAGWRGTAKNILLKTIQRMGEEFGSEPSDILAGIGPSISPEVYEVGAEVWNQFETLFYKVADPANPDKRFLDLWGANYYQLLVAGVPKSQIEIAGTCTFSDPDRFFSARRDGQKTGRMATGIMLR